MQRLTFARRFKCAARCRCSAPDSAVDRELFVVGLDIPDLAEWLLIVPIVCVIMGMYDILVRRYNILRFLFGMKPLSSEPAPVSGFPVISKRRSRSRNL
jgi:hypothetical protein